MDRAKNEYVWSMERMFRRVGMDTAAQVVSADPVPWGQGVLAGG